MRLFYFHPDSSEHQAFQLLSADIPDANVSVFASVCDLIAAARERGADASIAIVGANDDRAACEAIFEADPSLPILACVSADASPAGVQRLFASGASDCLPVQASKESLALRIAVLSARAGIPGRELLDNTTDVIYTVDNNLQFTYLNRAAELLSGYPRETVLGKHVSVVLAPPDVDLASRQLEAKGSSPTAETTYELVMNRADGTKIPIEVKTRALFRNGVAIGSQGIARDISDRKAAEAALLERTRALEAANQLNERIMQSVTDGILVLDRANRVRYVNETFCKITGVSFERFDGMELLSLLSAGDAERLGLLRDRVVHDRETITNIELRLTRADGREVVLQLGAAPLLEDDCVAGFVVVAHDATAEREAQALNARHAAIVESSQESIISTTLSGRITSWNPSAERIYGYTAAEAIGQHLSMLIPAGHHREATEFASQAFPNGTDGAVELVLRRKDGEAITVSLSVFPILDGSGTPVGLGGISRDETARKETERELLWRLSELQALFDLREALRSAQTIPEICEAGLRTLSTVYDTKRVSARLYDDSGVLRFVASHGLSETYRSAFEALSAKRPDLRMQVPVIEGDVSDDGTHRSIREPMLAEGIRAAASFPLRTADATIGHISLYRDEPTDFPANEVQLAETVASQIGTAIGRMRSEDALRMSEARYRAIVEDQTELVCRSQPDGTLTFVNDACRRYFGLNEGSVDTARLVQFLPDSEGLVITNARAGLRPGTPTVLFSHRVVIDGETRWLEWTDRGIFSARGDLTEIQSVGRDITGRRQAIEALSRSEANHRTVLEGTSDAIFAIDCHPDGSYHCALVNGTFSRIVGVPAEAIEGRPITETMPRRQRQWAIAHYEQAIAARQAIEYEETFVINGRETILVTVLNPLFNDDGICYRIVGSSRDITDRRESEILLRRLGRVVDNAPVEVYVVNAENLHYRQANRRALDNLGMELETLQSRTVYDMIVGAEPSDVTAVTAALWSGEREQVTFDGEHRRADGTTYPIEVLMQLSLSENPPVYVAIVQDITERLAAQEALATAQERLATVVSSAPLMFAAWDESGTITLGVGAGLAAIGVPAGATAPQIARFLGTQPSLRAGIDRALSGEAFSSEIVLLGKTWDTRFTPVRSATGAFTGGVLVALDVTERLEAERSQRISEDRNRAILAAMPDLLVLHDRDGNYLEVHAGSDSGVKEEWILGRNIREVIPPALAERALAAFARALDTGITEELDYAFEINETPAYFESRVTRCGPDQVLVLARNVTARVQAEHARRAADMNYRAVVEGTTDAMYVMEHMQDGSFICTVINEAYQKLLDRTPEDVIGKPLEAAIKDTAQQERILAHYRLAMSTRRPVSWEWTSEIRGETITAITQVSPVFDEHGRCLRLIGNMRDITQIKRAEEARIIAEDRLRTVVENAPLILWSIDADGTYTVCEGRGLVGINTVELVGRSLFSVHRDNEPLLASVRRGLAGEAFTSTVTMAGIVLETFHAPLRDASGAVVGLSGVSVDVTEKVRADEQRALAEERLRALVDNVPVALFSLDPAGNFTAATGRSLPRARDQVIGQSAFELNAGNTAAIDSIHRALAGESFTSVHAGTNDTWWETHYLPILDDTGAVSSVTGVALDVTERRRAEEAMLQSQKLESLGVLAGGIAHDFNNLLVGILGNAGLALAELAPESPARETVQDIELAGQRAADLARQMLAYSGKGRFVVQRLALDSLVEEMTHLLRVSITRGAALSYRFAPDLPAVEADATQLRQVVMNLVVNASDAIGEQNGVITLTTGTMFADRAYLADSYMAPDAPEGEYVFLEVSDTGNGMDAETRARIFDPFFTTKFTGRGLGLAAVLGIVRGHRGAIKVVSEPGRGASFRLLLPPLSEPATPIPTVRSRPGALRGSGTVLVVDDEETVRNVTARALELSGYQVLKAVDGFDAQRVFQEYRDEISCVLLDLTMPNCGGEEAFDAIRRIRPDARVILMSGYAEQEATEHFLARGLAGFIQKPYELGSLQRAVREATLMPVR
ncbi:hypothetical protein AYO38_08115 [bacterium SCGC AG-212-C10]|nr:hypothetical protein AYO38_08115 [bacterium SCGC AG-212-C10]